VIYLLDTNVVIGLLAGKLTLLRQVREHVPEDFGISAISAHELYFGACKSRRRAENVARVEALRFAVLEFDKEDAQHSGEIRAVLAAAGMPIGPYDVLIAGQARARDLILITHNTAEFSRVSGLRLQDWEI
jgi:tRNA(fMet)-specific endonuclease VapC